VTTKALVAVRRYGDKTFLVTSETLEPGHVYEFHGDEAIVVDEPDEENT
jgi:hypothetical protein